MKNYRKVIDNLIRVTKTKGYILVGIPYLAHLINRIYLMFGVQPMCIHLDGPHVRGYTHKAFVELLTSLEEAKLIDLHRFNHVSLTLFYGKIYCPLFCRINWICLLSATKNMMRIL